MVVYFTYLISYVLMFIYVDLHRNLLRPMRPRPKLLGIENWCCLLRSQLEKAQLMLDMRLLRLPSEYDNTESWHL